MQSEESHAVSGIVALGDGTNEKVASLMIECSFLIPLRRDAEISDGEAHALSAWVLCCDWRQLDALCITKDY
jgi:hypothetical protein